MATPPGLSRLSQKYGLSPTGESDFPAGGGLGTFVELHRDLNGFDLHLQPWRDIWISDTVIFRIELPPNFPKEKPIIKCIRCEESIRNDPRLLMVYKSPPPPPSSEPENLDEGSDLDDDDDGAYESPEEVDEVDDQPKLYISRIDKDGTVHLNLTESEYMGWLEFYDMEVIIHSIRILFRRTDAELAPSSLRYVHSNPKKVSVRCGSSSEQGRRNAMEDRLYFENCRFIPDPELSVLRMKNFPQVEYSPGLQRIPMDDTASITMEHDAVPLIGSSQSNFSAKQQFGYKRGDAGKFPVEMISNSGTEIGSGGLGHVIPSGDFEIEEIRGRKISFHAVLDGHGGWKTAEFASSAIGNYFYEELMQKDISIERAVYNAIAQTEERLSDIAKAEQDRTGYIINTSGSTLCAVAIDLDQGVLYCANVGDSRAVLCRQSGNALALSEDQKANRPDEVARVVHTGGFVSYGRVLGMLAVSRALGDPEMKAPNPLIIAIPEIVKVHLSVGDQFVVVACDGIFDVMTNQEVVDFVSQKIDIYTNAEDINLDEICASLVQFAISSRGSDDNVSVIIIQIRDNTEESVLACSPSPTSNVSVHPSGFLLSPLKKKPERVVSKALDLGLSESDSGKDLAVQRVESFPDSLLEEVKTPDQDSLITEVVSLPSILDSLVIDGQVNPSSVQVQGKSESFLSPTVQAAALASRLRKHGSTG